MGVLRGRLVWNRDGDDRAASRIVAQRQRAAQSIDALANAAETEMPAPIVDTGHRQPASVVLDHELHEGLPEAELHVDVCRLRVLDAVGECLETNAQQVMFVRPVQWAARSGGSDP